MIVALQTREHPALEEIQQAQRAAMVALAANVRRRRVARGMTQVEMAELVGRTQGWVSQLEKGQIEDVPLGQVVALAKVLGVSVSSLTRQSTDQ